MCFVSRAKAKSLISSGLSAPQLPYQLDVISEEGEGDMVKRRSHRERSPALWRESIQKPPKDSYRVPRGVCMCGVCTCVVCTCVLCTVHVWCVLCTVHLWCVHV